MVPMAGLWLKATKDGAFLADQMSYSICGLYTLHTIVAAVTR